jgi:ABC-type ATPase involved in cell division
MLTALLRERMAAGHAALVATHDLAFVDALGARRVRLVAGRIAEAEPHGDES